MSWTSEQLLELRAYAAEHRVVDSDCAMSLIAEVERLRELLASVGAIAHSTPRNLFKLGVNPNGDAINQLRDLLKSRAAEGGVA